MLLRKSQITCCHDTISHEAEDTSLLSSHVHFFVILYTPMPFSYTWQLYNLPKYQHHLILHLRFQSLRI